MTATVTDRILNFSAGPGVLPEDVRIEPSPEGATLNAMLAARATIRAPIQVRGLIARTSRLLRWEGVFKPRSPHRL